MPPLTLKTSLQYVKEVGPRKAESHSAPGPLVRWKRGASVKQTEAGQLAANVEDSEDETATVKRVVRRVPWD